MWFSNSSLMPSAVAKIAENSNNYPWGAYLSKSLLRVRAAREGACLGLGA